MARIVEMCDGAEWGDSLYWDATAGTITSSTAQKRSGDRSYAFSGTSDGTKNLPSALNEYYRRFAFRASTIMLNASFVRFRLGTTIMVSLTINAATRRIEANLGSITLLATGVTSLQDDTWYLIETHIKIANAGGIFAVKIDGVQEINFSGDTQVGADTTIDNELFSGSNASLYVDDLGADDAAWCGDGHIYLLKPNANGDQSDWTGSDGDKIDNYALVDEEPPSSVDYVQDSVINEFDLYNLEASGLSGVNINHVWVDGRAQSTTASGDKLSLGIKSGVTEDWCADIDLTNSWRRVVGEDYAVDPDTGIAWTIGGVDGLQAGEKVR